MVIIMLMDSVSEGAVLVSFGSALKPEQMPAEKIQVFVDTFKNLGMKVVQYIQHMIFFFFQSILAFTNDIVEII